MTLNHHSSKRFETMTTSRRAQDDSEQRPFTSSPGNLLYRVGDGLRRALEEELATLSLALPHYLLLATVAERGPRSQLALGGCAAINRTRMVALIDDLEEQRLVERRPDPADRRAYQIHLTEQGSARLAQALARQAAVEEAWLRPLSASERAQFLELLNRITPEAVGGADGKDS
jgi:DNA-binding MarR family transcriptional regulator